jgi:hypothetical protein
VSVSLLKTDGKYYLYKKTQEGQDSKGTKILFTMNELYLGSIYSGVSVGYVADVDNFDTAVSAAEEELFHLAKEV